MCSVLSDFDSDLNSRLSVSRKLIYLVMTDRHQTQIAVKTENTTHPVVTQPPDPSPDMGRHSFFGFIRDLRLALMSR